MDALKREGENDFVLAPGEDSVWITVDNISVYVRRENGGVKVRLFPFTLEAEGDAMDQAEASFDSARALIEDMQAHLDREQ